MIAFWLRLHLFHNRLLTSFAWASIIIVIGLVLVIAYIAIESWWMDRRRSPAAKVEFDDFMQEFQRLSYPYPSQLTQQQFYEYSTTVQASRSVNETGPEAPPTIDPSTPLEWPMEVVAEGLSYKMATTMYINELHELIKDLQEQIDDMNEGK